VLATTAARQAAVLDGSRAAALFAVVICVSVGTGWRYMRRVGGITGDFLGATEQLGEIATLAVLVWKS
jgi:adenosylcobinamide-GDP ribazoletransferase